MHALFSPFVAAQRLLVYPIGLVVLLPPTGRRRMKNVKSIPMAERTKFNVIVQIILPYYVVKCQHYLPQFCYLRLLCPDPSGSDSKIQ